MYTCAARNTAARSPLHRRWYLADPDVLMLAPFPPLEARTVMTLGAFAGGPYLLSDKLAHLDDERWDIAAHPVLSHLAEGPGFRAVDLFARVDADGDDRFVSSGGGVLGGGVPRVWVQHRFDGTAIALFNWGDEPWPARLPWDALGAGPGTGWTVTDLWSGTALPPSGERLEVDVASHDVALLWIGAGSGPA
jgi:hypothetical protein